MRLVLVGVNHKTAPVAVRERYSVAPAAVEKLNAQLVLDSRVQEAALISTCNRTELLVVTDDADVAIRLLHEFFRDAIASGAVEERGHFYDLGDAEVVDHLFRVAASLDSMAVGEAQILGQVKSAYRAAVAAGGCGPVLNRLFQRAFRTAKRVRSETGLGASQISVARVGVQLARELFESFDGKRVLLIGAGDMAESAVFGLQDAGVRDVVVVNRTLEHAERLARRLGGRGSPLSELGRELIQADVALASVQVDSPLLRVEEVRASMAGRSGRPLLLVDLGLPRNVDPDVNQLDDVFLYDLDDLDRVAAQGVARRRQEVEPAEAIVREECERFERWQAGLGVAPILSAVVDRVRQIADESAQRAIGRLDEPSEETQRALERLARDVAGQLLHTSLARLRAEAEEDGASYYADAVREIFGLDD
jgi:glutamyl-tRNA reductase